jgi:two-component system sensor histidine kinase TctE
MNTWPLRLRLTAIILPPLIVIGLAVGLWQLANARATAEDLFDRSLLTTALAVAGDVARSDGEILSPATSALLRDTSGGQVFYHVYAPDGIFVVGYATPPVPQDAAPNGGTGPSFYDGIYFGRDVRVARLRDQATIGGFSGTFTITVWQDVALRQTLARALVTRSAVVICVLIGTVALVVWFGVRLGLRPLLDLEDAIRSRSSDDLAPIRRAVPQEARGIVDTLNALLGQVSTAMEAQNTFISSAAHQLRNPIAGVQAMAEAVQGAPSGAAARARAGELVKAARNASALANKLLALERAKTTPIADPCDLTQILPEALRGMHADATARGCALTLDVPSEPLRLLGDKVMLGEAAVTLVDNALRHGGPGLGQVRVSLRREGDMAMMTVADDGLGVSPDDVPKITARFGQARPGQGSGLGLSIAEEVARRHGGTLKIDATPPDGGFVARICFPLTPVAADQRPAA